ncbi:MAG: ABC transporter permease [Spirochaetales bacterium]|nr:ABC transporter permease [Spirochaetales bacterium]
MKNEPMLIVQRRFTGRILESGLLILAVALGVGAAASGLSLLLHTNSYSRKMLESPEYRELIVSTQDNASDMETPLIETVKGDDVILTYEDLEAAELVPQVSYAYLSGKSRMRFMNEQFLAEMQQMEASRPEAGAGENSPEGQDALQPPDGGDFRENMTSMMEEAASDSSIIIPEIEELYGYEVTPQFFSAWNLEAQFGSLFTQSDMNGTSDYVVLGIDAARMINLNDEPLENLIGKKILSMRDYYIIAGILEETGTAYDESYFSLDKQAGFAGAMDRFRPGGNKQLRFTVADPEDLDAAAELLSSWFASEYGEGQTVISNPREEAEKLMNRNRGISYLILFLSTAGLFIASVNISNILMSRTLRMKKHVGILKALGASNVSILKLFSAEAAAITAIGAILGTIIAFPLAGAMETAMGLEKGSWILIFAGVLLSSILTFAFSVIPSFQNSGFEAAEAMRQAG